MPIPFHLVNAFTLSPSSPHSGNQASVVQLRPEDGKTDEWKQPVARDFGFAETAYVEEVSIDEETGVGEWGLRWWTPATEVILCGHATLASAHTLYTIHPKLNKINFHTRWSGTLFTSRVPLPPFSGSANAKEGADFLVEMSLPSIPPSITSTINATTHHEGFTRTADAWLSAAPELMPSDILRVFRFPLGKDAEPEGVIVEVKDDVDLAKLKVKLGAINEVSSGMNILTQAKSSECDTGVLRIDSRVFCPGMGVDEDSVTGSAHAYLTAYYTSPAIFPLLPAVSTNNGQMAPGEVRIEARQLSVRGGALVCYAEEGRAKIAGRGTIWGQGHLTV